MLRSGDRFGDYKVVKLLGQGGMGSVFLLETAEGAQVAAKILNPEAAGDHASRKRFVREAELACGVKHPNLVETYDVGEDPDTGLCYLLMEYVSGGSLQDRLKTGPLSISGAIRIVSQIVSVLELAQQRGIVHRDIKPGNIMFGADGKAKLADLGIARRYAGSSEATVTETGVMMGTPAYMAPEQMLDARRVDSRADIYSLGAVFYEMLTGQRPRSNDTVFQLMAKAVAGVSIPDVRQLRPEVSAPLAELVSRMCAMKADERISTPAEVAAELSKIVFGRGAQVEHNPLVAHWRTRWLPLFVCTLSGLAIAWSCLRQPPASALVGATGGSGSAWFSGRDSTQRVQQTLDEHFPGWTTSENAAEAVRPGEEIGHVAEICGRHNVLATLPPSKLSPIRLTRTMFIPKKVRLCFTVRKNPTADGGLTIRVYANGKRRWEGAVTGDGWRTYEIDLSDLANTEAQLEIRHLIHPDFGNARALWSKIAVE